MWNNIKAFFNFASEQGLRLPAAFDPDKPGPSSTLLFAYIAFIIASGGVIYLCITNISAGVISAIILWTLAVVFYMMRKLSKFKADLDDKSIELDNGDDDKK